MAGAVAVVDEDEDLAAETRVLIRFRGRRGSRGCIRRRRGRDNRALWLGRVEVRDLLQLAVFEDLEVIARQSADRRGTR